MNPQTAFLDVLLAAMKDAALERKLTQLALQFDPTEKAGRATHRIRIVVIPEELDYTWPAHSPLGSAGVG
jgi:hypothetical protein